MKKITGVLAGLAVAISAQAQPIKIDGTIKQAIPITNSSNHSAGNQMKTVTVMKVELSDEAKKMLAKRIEKFHSENDNNVEISKNVGKRVTKVDLGMNNVPVLDQGKHGSCVTFAVSAVIDAALGKGDHVSQLCSLELGNYLNQNAYQPSGWDGSFGNIVINQMDTFGWINKKSQEDGLCAGVKDYPASNPEDQGNPLAVQDYHKLSETINEKNQMQWGSIAEVSDYLHNSFDPAKIMSKMKDALAQGQRCTIGVLLPIDYGMNGATGKYHETNDSWVLTDEMLNNMDNLNLGGHEMAVIGYDDTATATGVDKTKYRSLLKLRNSWGNNVGDKGEFYMGYSFFKAFVIEAHCLYNTPKKA